MMSTSAVLGPLMRHGSSGTAADTLQLPGPGFRFYPCPPSRSCGTIAADLSACYHEKKSGSAIAG